MTRCFVDQPLAEGASAALPTEVAHHLVHVLRLAPGAPLVLFDGSGGEYEATLEAAGKREARARIGRHVAVERESPLRVTLAQCVSKGERMDYTLQKAVELGVQRIVPLLSAHSVVRLDAERWQKKLAHWRGVIVSACEQSGRTRVPELAPVLDLDRWLQQGDDSALKLTLAPGAAQPLHALATSAPASVALLIGPEGGLSVGEIALAGRVGFAPVALGPRVLRTETAGVAALAALQALWGDWR